MTGHDKIGPVAESLKKIGACDRAVLWATPYEDPEAAWRECPSPCWLAWYIGRDFGRMADATCWDAWEGSECDAKRRRILAMSLEVVAPLLVAAADNAALAEYAAHVASFAGGEGGPWEMLERRQKWHARLQESLYVTEWTGSAKALRCARQAFHSLFLGATRCVLYRGSHHANCLERMVCEATWLDDAVSPGEARKAILAHYPKPPH